MADARYEWDPNKAAGNKRKHRVAFEEAILALEDDNAVVELDDSDPTEVRWRTTGLGANRILFVVSTEISRDTVRIISARKANHHEQATYYRQALP